MTSEVESRAIMNAPFHTRAPGRELTWAMGDEPAAELAVLADSAQTSMGCTLAEHRFPAGFEIGLHTHLLEDEGFYVLEGEVTFSMPDDGLELAASVGEFVWHPANRRHGLRVSDNGSARLLQFLLPGTELVPNFFRRFDTKNGGSGKSPEELARESREDFGLVLDVPGAPGLEPLPASVLGPVTTEATVIESPAPSVSNSPFKSDHSHEWTLQIGSGMMTNVGCIPHAYGHQTGNKFGLVEIDWGRGDATTPHIHTLEDEGFYVLEGEITLHVASPDGVVHAVARAGDFVYAPRNMKHYYDITGDPGARVLVFELPGGTLTEFFQRIAQEGWGADISTDEKIEEFAQWSIETAGIHFFAHGDFPEVDSGGDHPEGSLVP